MIRSGVPVLFILILAPFAFADTEARTRRQTDGAAVEANSNIPVPTLEAVGSLVRSFETLENLQRLRRDAEDEEGEERTFHRLKKKKHKFQLYQKPSHGYFGQPVLFPDYHGRPPAWKPQHAISQFVNIFNQGSHANHGYHKPIYKPPPRPPHKPHGGHKPGHYQVYEDIQEDWPNPWAGGFLALGPQYPFVRADNKVAPGGGRQYRSYTTAPLLSYRNVEEKTTTEDSPVAQDISNSSETDYDKKDNVVFKD